VIEFLAQATSYNLSKS